MTHDIYIIKLDDWILRIHRKMPGQLRDPLPPVQPLDRGHFIPAKVCEGPKGMESDTFFGIKDSRNNKEERARHGTGIMINVVKIHTYTH